MRSSGKIWFASTILLAVVALLFVWPLVSLAIFLAWLAYMIGAATFYQVCQGRSLERGLGFEHGKLYQHVGGRLHSSLAIRSVVAGRPFANAGFLQDDILPAWSITDFFRQLHRNRGRVVEFEVVTFEDADRTGKGPPFGERPRRTLHIAVPTTAEAPPTRADYLEAISLAWMIISIPVAFAIGWLIALAIRPTGPLWAQIIIWYLSFSVFVGPGMYAVSSRGNRQRPTDNEGARA